MAGSRPRAYVAALQRKYQRQFAPRRVVTPTASSTSVSAPVSSGFAQEQPELTGAERFAAAAGDTLMNVAAIAASTPFAPFLGAVTGGPTTTTAEKKERMQNALSSPVAGNIFDAISTPLYGVTAAGQNIIDTIIGNVSPERATDRQRETAKNVRESLKKGDIASVGATFDPITQAMQVWTGNDGITSSLEAPKEVPNERVTGADIIDSIASQEGPSERGVIGTPFGDIGYDWIRGVGGLGIDIFADPLTYVSGAGLLKAARVGRLTTAGRGPAGAARVASEASKGAQIRDFAQRYSENWRNTRSAQKWARDENGNILRDEKGRKVRNQQFKAGREFPSRFRDDPEAFPLDAQPLPGRNTPPATAVDDVVEDAAQAVDDGIEQPALFDLDTFAREVANYDGPKIEVPKSTLPKALPDDVNAAYRNVMGENPDIDLNDVPIAELPKELRSALNVVDEIPAGRQALEIESPFVRQLVEEAAQVKPKKKGGKKPAFDTDDLAAAREAVNKLYRPPGSSMRAKKVPFADIVKIRDRSRASGRWTAEQEATFRMFVAEQQRARALLARAQEAARASETASDALPVSPSGEAVNAAPGATSQASGGAVALTGQARAQWRNRLRSRLLNKGLISPEEYKRLIEAKTAEEFDEAVAAIKSAQVPSPVHAPRPKADDLDVSSQIEIPEIDDLNSAVDDVLDNTRVIEDFVSPAPEYLTPMQAERIKVFDRASGGGQVDLTPYKNEALKYLYEKHLSKALEKSMPHRSPRKALKTEPEMYKGRARWRRMINTPAQVYTYDQIAKSIRKDLMERGIRGLTLDETVLRRTLLVQKAVDDEIKAMGGTLFLGYEDGIALSMSDIIPRLAQNPSLTPLFATVDTLVSTQNVLTAVERMLNQGVKLTKAQRRKLVKDALTTDLKGGAKNRLMLPDPNSIGLRRWYVRLTGNEPPTKMVNGKPKQMPLKSLPAREVEKFTKAFVRDNVKNLTDEIVNRYDEFVELEIANRKRLNLENNQKAGKIQEAVITAIGNKYAGMGFSATDFADMIINRAAHVERVADEIGASAQAVETGMIMVDDALFDIVPREVVEKAETIAIADDNFLKPAATTKRVFDKWDQQFARLQLMRSVDDVKNLETTIDDSMTVALNNMKARMPVFNSSGLGQFENLADALPAARNVAQDVSQTYFRQLNIRAQKWKRVPSPVDEKWTTFDHVFDHLMSGSAEGLRKFDPDAVRDVQEFARMLWGSDPDTLQSALLDNAMLQTGVPQARINELLNIRKVGYQFDEVRAAARVALGDEAFFELESAARNKIAGRRQVKPSDVKNRDVHSNLAAKYEKAAKALRNPDGTWKTEYQRQIKDALANQWKDADVPRYTAGKHEGLPDYAMFAANQINATMNALVETTTTYSLVKSLSRTGAISTVKRAGYKRIARTGAIGSNLPEGLWFHPDTVEPLMKVERLIADMYRDPNLVVRFAQQWVMPFLDTWKTGMTIYRPGHHIRNGIGDISLSQLAGRLKTPGMFKDAFKVSRANGGSAFKVESIYEQQAREAARSLKFMKYGEDPDLYKTPTGPVRMEIRLKNGRVVELDDTQIWNSAKNRGNLIPAHIRENLMIEADPTAAKGANRREQIRRVFGTPGRLVGKEDAIRTKAVRASELRDHTIRLAHYMEFIKAEARHYDNLSDLFDDAASEVRKFHPDGTGLTQFERDYLVPLFPFYSWTRKAVPLVFEMMITQPGRFMVFPKAMYNLAIANGIDLEGYGEPFPEDQLFPSFLRERALGATADARSPLGQLLGPMIGQDSGYIGVNPGFAQVDVINQFAGQPVAAGIPGNGPFEGLMNSLSPAVRTPIEMATGQSLGIGAPVTDWSDYLDMQIPGFNIANSVAGVSPTAYLGADLLGGEEFTPTSRSVDRGLKRPFLNPATVNLLTGLGITNMSQPNYINLAEIEQRNGRTY